MCHIILYGLCTLIVLIVGYAIFSATNQGRCVDLAAGWEYSHEEVRTATACRNLGGTWVFEDFPESVTRPPIGTPATHPRRMERGKWHGRRWVKRRDRGGHLGILKVSWIIEPLDSHFSSYQLPVPVERKEREITYSPYHVIMTAMYLKQFLLLHLPHLLPLVSAIHINSCFTGKLIHSLVNFNNFSFPLSVFSRALSPSNITSKQQKYIRSSTCTRRARQVSTHKIQITNFYISISTLHTCIDAYDR